ncbi:uncharacterized protein ALTATR162_LOCUS12088 [Alternaria atra]|uniref:Uncharacterized protein n=1 Tax=Alternaria atra TaxID=119953 RepID=A0A8J2ICB2_9PLEO|nr:uncharacterized protein ALTATR162_LOCUS12088 [Alternaria atra]CAG5189807.1 unnamed protein product [Alternaria atra]
MHYDRCTRAVVLKPFVDRNELLHPTEELLYVRYLQHAELDIERLGGLAGANYRQLVTTAIVPAYSGDPSSPRSEPLVLRSPFPAAVYQEAIAGDLGRGTCTVGHVRPLSGKLELLSLDEWNENETYDEEPPTCVHYSIEWKVTLNNKLLSKDTEPDLVLAPRFYWSLFLREKLERLLQKKLPPMTERSKRDLTKRFDEMDVDWFLVERQLSQWSESFRAGPPCSLGPHCWRDPHGKKHYKLRTHQLKVLIRHVAQGGQLRSHDDVPEDVRQQLYAEEQQQLERHQRASHSALAGHAPIHITNVLPGPSHSTSGSTEVQAKPRLDMPGFLDAAVEEYSDWQQSRVRREDQKDDIRNMCDMALEHGLDLQQLHDDQDPDFFISRGIKIGVARRFLRDIEYWVQQQVAATDQITID